MCVIHRRGSLTLVICYVCVSSKCYTKVDKCVHVLLFLLETLVLYKLESYIYRLVIKYIGYNYIFLVSYYFASYSQFPYFALYTQ